MALLELASLVLQAPHGDAPAGGGFIESLPDPMKANLGEIAVVVGLVTVLYIYLRLTFFKPLGQVMDERDRDLHAGSDTKARAMAMVEARQKDYQGRLKDLRAQAFSHRKSLADAAGAEKTRLVEEARAKAAAQREQALAALKDQQEAAKRDLVAQVDVLADTMVQQLLKQA